ncbi:MAG: hypothetical protein P4M11_05655 [Candidatus Pacebacteria bacterium]|nr:hypothetical protein [Candidatus Paceibacterota bacterium]
MDFTYKKFRTADDTSYIIRDAASESGCPVIFKVKGLDLSTLKSEGRFPDFDAESDALLKDLVIAPGTEQIYFEWVGSAFHRM